MSRRRNRKNQDIIGSLVALSMLGAFWVVFNSTHSFASAGVAAGVIFGIAFVTLILVRLIHEEKLKRSGIHEIDKMDGRQFELYLGHLFLVQAKHYSGRAFSV